MANYATLKAAIAAAIRENGNNEITGTLLQQQLLAMVNSLGVGYQYAGIATPTTNPGTPDQNVFYIASTAGTYTNFGGLVLADGEIAILKYNGAWSKDSTGAASLEIVNQLGQYVENPEWVRVVTDAEGRVLYGVKTDGEFYFGAGCPQQVKDFVESHEREIKVLIDGKVDKEEGKSLINAVFAGAQSLVENPQFFQAITDANGNFLEGIEQDGTKTIAGNIKIFGNIISGNLQNRLYEKIDKVKGGKSNEDILTYFYTINSPEWLFVIKDEDGNVVYGIKKDGTSTAEENKENNKTDILTLFPKEQIIPLLRNYKFGDMQHGDYVETYSPLVLLHFSDIHEDARSLSRISKFYNEYKQWIDDVVFTGDMVDNVFNPDLTLPFWTNNGGGKFLYVNGNHDAASALSPFMPVSPKQNYDAYIAPFLAETNINYVENKCYWYKDYPKAKSNECPGGIRLIALDQYHWKEQEVIGDYVPSTYPDGTSVDTGQQETWLENLLDDALENGLAVITALHSPLTNTKCTDIDCTFNCLDRDATAAYSEIPIGMLQKVQAFINAGGEFICWMAGHMHQDWFVKITDFPDQVIMLISTSSDIMTYRDSVLIPGSNYTDRFNIFSIQPKKKHIRLYRIGLDFDKYGRHLGRLVYDYKNQEIIFNS